MSAGMSDAMTGGWSLLMLPMAVLAMVVSGAPAFAVLIGVAMLAALVGVATASFDPALLQAAVPRLVGLLEHDLLQALALYALVGALLQRLSIAALWLRVVARWVGIELALLGLALLTAPLNGSVGASLALLRGAADAQLQHLPPERRVALLAVACTLGVVVPPSLVLLLLGDAMLRAHTEALAMAPQPGVQVINTGALISAAGWPVLLVVLAVLGVTLALRATVWRGAPKARPGPAPTRAQQAAVGVATLGVLGLVVSVAQGWVLAVEGAAVAGVGLWLLATLAGWLRGQQRALLDDALSTTGMVFGLLVGATCFSLVLRGYGADAWLAAQAQGLSPKLLLAAVLCGLLLCGFVLDAFEIIFLLVPIVMPPLLAVQPHAAWVAVLTLLALQIGYLLPPLGFAVLMARGDEALDDTRLRRALAPYLLVLVAVLAAVLAWPALCGTPPQLTPQLDADEVLRQLQGFSR